jgi:hypothetical protein
MTYARMSLLAILTLALSAAWMPAATAQTGGEQPQAPEATQDLTDQQLRTYAVAALEVRRISQSYQPALQAAKSEADQKAVQQEAVQKMTETIREKGLSVEEYNRITSVAQSDPGIASQVQQYMSQTQQ